jgi:hypothetical protein
MAPVDLMQVYTAAQARRHRNTCLAGPSKNAQDTFYFSRFLDNSLLSCSMTATARRSLKPALLSTARETSPGLSEQTVSGRMAGSVRDHGLT